MPLSPREPPVRAQLSFHLKTSGFGCGMGAWLSTALALLGIAVSVALAKGWI